MTRIKICGITNMEDALLATELGADAIGFVFAESPRNVKKEAVRGIIRNLPPFITTVGVFVNEDIEKVRGITVFCGLDCVQLHGDEPPDYCLNVWNGPVIKAVRVKDENSIAVLKDYLCADAFLLDAYIKESYGGTGRRFDHDLAIRAKGFKKPVILSGGITADNVTEAVKKVRPYAVDCSSGIESSPGKKDPKLLTSLINNIKALDASS